MKVPEAYQELIGQPEGKWTQLRGVGWPKVKGGKKRS